MYYCVQWDYFSMSLSSSSCGSHLLLKTKGKEIRFKCFVVVSAVKILCLCSISDFASIAFLHFTPSHCAIYHSFCVNTDLLSRNIRNILCGIPEVRIEIQSIYHTVYSVFHSIDFNSDTTHRIEKLLLCIYAADTIVYLDRKSWPNRITDHWLSKTNYLPSTFSGHWLNQFPQPPNYPKIPINFSCKNVKYFDHHHRHNIGALIM